MFSFLLPSLVYAHPGRTDSSGCHTCYSSCVKWGLKSGMYHCHSTKVKTESKHFTKRTAK